MKNDAFHILWYVNLYLYMDLMEREINTNTNTNMATMQRIAATIDDKRKRSAGTSGVETKRLGLSFRGLDPIKRICSFIAMS
jgi:hypothetical protein